MATVTSAELTQLHINERHKEQNWRKAVFSIDVSKAPSSLPMRKGTACALKGEGSSSALLVTSSQVMHGVDTSTHVVSSTRFCPKYPNHEEKHCIKEVQHPWKIEQFCFVPLQTTPKYCLELVSAEKLREAGEMLSRCDCLSYTFSGNTFKTMEWEFSEEKDTHVLMKVSPKGDLVKSACRGSPVVSKQDDRIVIGVVDCTSDGSRPIFNFLRGKLFTSQR